MITYMYAEYNIDPFSYAIDAIVWQRGELANDNINFYKEVR